jgi:exopolysaccharide biosynthesis polyprenyl glycosylphosphotransferase
MASRAQSDSTSAAAILHAPQPDPLLPGSERTIQSVDAEVGGTTTATGSTPSVGHSRTAGPLLRLAPGDQRRAHNTLLLLVGGDSVAIGAALLLGELLTTGRWPGALADIAYVPVVILVFCGYGLYRRARRRLVASTFPDLSQIIHGLIVGALIILLTTSLITRATSIPIVSRRAMIITGLIALMAIPLGRMLSRRLAGRNGRRSRVLIVGSGLVAARIAARMAAAPDLDVVGCVDDSPGQRQLGRRLTDSPDRHSEAALLGGLDDIPRLVAEHNVDRLVVAFSPITESQVAARLRSMADQVQICVVPRMFDLLTVRSRVDELAGLPVIDVAPPSLGPADRFAKRSLDVVVSGLALLLLAPVIAVLAIIVKTTSPGPILFRQQRIGRRGRPFLIYKFRTMDVGAEEKREDLAVLNSVDGPIFKLHDDPRITRPGRVLRPTSLDELPQLLNVFKGDMSLVGPRPFITVESNEIEGWAARRFDVRPGVTGLWQVSGRNDLPFDELQRLDYSYVASWSLWWDLRILWHTPASVLRRDGAY